MLQNIIYSLNRSWVIYIGPAIEWLQTHTSLYTTVDRKGGADNLDAEELNDVSQIFLDRNQIS